MSLVFYSYSFEIRQYVIQGTESYLLPCPPDTGSNPSIRCDNEGYISGRLLEDKVEEELVSFQHISSPVKAEDSKHHRETFQEKMYCLLKIPFHRFSSQAQLVATHERALVAWGIPYSRSCTRTPLFSEAPKGRLYWTHGSRITPLPHIWANMPNSQ